MFSFGSFWGPGLTWSNLRGNRPVLNNNRKSSYDTTVHVPCRDLFHQTYCTRHCTREGLTVPEVRAAQSWIPVGSGCGEIRLQLSPRLSSTVRKLLSKETSHKLEDIKTGNAAAYLCDRWNSRLCELQATSTHLDCAETFCWSNSILRCTPSTE